MLFAIFILCYACSNSEVMKYVVPVLDMHKFGYPVVAFIPESCMIGHLYAAVSFLVAFLQMLLLRASQIVAPR